MRNEGFDVREVPLESFSQPAPGFSDVAVLNLMPVKPTTELDFARVCARTGLSLRLCFFRLDGQTFKHTSEDYIRSFYLSFSQLRQLPPRRLIVTGAPLEQIAFEDVRYWQPLCELMDWADRHVPSTLYVCWAAQAALYHFNRVPKHAIPEKRFGIFPVETAGEDVLKMAPACRRFLEPLAPCFMMPHSRHSEVRLADFPTTGADAPLPLASGADCGLSLAATADLRRVFVTGHLEYASETLHNEYQRDLAKGLPIQPPLNYYSPEGEIQNRWLSSAVTFYRRFLE